MSVTTYTTVNGMILSQAKGGVVSHFVPDPLGSVVMVRDTSGNTVYEAEYDPYGNVQSETGTNPSSLGYVGTLGYIKDSATSMYVRARYLLSNLGRWLTKDPLWPSESGYVYASAAPSQITDRTGLNPWDECGLLQWSGVVCYPAYALRCARSCLSQGRWPIFCGSKPFSCEFTCLCADRPDTTPPKPNPNPGIGPCSAEPDDCMAICLDQLLTKFCDRFVYDYRSYLLCHAGVTGSCVYLCSKVGP